MEIRHSITGNKGSFYIEENNERLAEMTFAMSGPSKMVIEHTEVDKKLAGKGIGKQLVSKGVEYARANNFKILPLCPFAKSLFEKIPEFGDVLF